MRLIESTGGKGGTGKSTFVILLALKLSERAGKAGLCDCDVECPNGYLLLRKDLRQPEPVHTKLPKLNEEKCISCGT